MLRCTINTAVGGSIPVYYHRKQTIVFVPLMKWKALRKSVLTPKTIQVLE